MNNGVSGVYEHGVLPEKFNEIPMEFRLLQKKFDKQQIFTNVSNEVRLENIMRSHQYREDNKTDIVRGESGGHDRTCVVTEVHIVIVIVMDDDGGIKAVKYMCVAK